MRLASPVPTEASAGVNPPCNNHGLPQKERGLPKAARQLPRFLESFFFDFALNQLAYSWRVRQILAAFLLNHQG